MILNLRMRRTLHCRRPSFARRMPSDDPGTMHNNAKAAPALGALRRP